MGVNHTKELLRAAFDNDDCKLDAVHTYGSTGILAVAHTRRAMTYTDHGPDVYLAAKRVLSNGGVPKRVYYVRGTPREMGYLMGSVAWGGVEDMCTTWVEHLPPQFVSESLDVTMMAQPALFQSAYQLVLRTITDVLVEGAVSSFNEAVRAGDIPTRFVEEMKGLHDGVRSVRTVSNVTWERVIAANYGMDYLMREVLSGRLLERIQGVWERLPTEVTRLVPKFLSKYLVIPDMCNAAMAWGPATRSGHDVFMMRDFQFHNARVFHRRCTMIVRIPLGHGCKPHLAVAMPGMVGHVTSVNASGVATGMNLVHSTAVDTDRLGAGCMFMMRHIAETADSSADVEFELRRHHRGVPWIYYSIDSKGDCRVFETFAKRWEGHLTADKWVTRHRTRLDAPSPQEMAAWVPPGDSSHGVWRRSLPRSCPPKAAEDTLRAWTNRMAGPLGHPEISQPQRWDDGGALFNSWVDEKNSVEGLSYQYFPPWRNHSPGVCVVNNSFLNPLLRLTQMSQGARMACRSATGNQWRYDTLSNLLLQRYGDIDGDVATGIVDFLSPWKRPLYPQNTGHRARHLALPPLEGGGDNPDKEGVVVAGALSMVDAVRMSIKTKTGYWGCQFYTLTLTHYLFTTA